MNEIVSLLKEIKAVLIEIRNGITEIIEGSSGETDSIYVGATVYDADGRAIIVTRVNTDTFQAEYVD